MWPPCRCSGLSSSVASPRFRLCADSDWRSKTLGLAAGLPRDGEGLRPRLPRLKRPRHDPRRCGDDVLAGCCCSCCSSGSGDAPGPCSLGADPPAIGDDDSDSDNGGGGSDDLRRAKPAAHSLILFLTVFLVLCCDRFFCRPPLGTMLVWTATQWNTACLPVLPCDAAASCTSLITLSFVSPTVLVVFTPSKMLPIRIPARSAGPPATTATTLCTRRPPLAVLVCSEKPKPSSALQPTKNSVQRGWHPSRHAAAGPSASVTLDDFERLSLELNLVPPVGERLRDASD